MVETGGGGGDRNKLPTTFLVESWLSCVGGLSAEVHCRHKSILRIFRDDDFINFPRNNPHECKKYAAPSAIDDSSEEQHLPSVIELEEGPKFVISP